MNAVETHTETAAPAAEEPNALAALGAIVGPERLLAALQSDA